MVKSIAKFSVLLVGLTSIQAMAAGQDLQQLQQSVKKAAETKLSENATTKISGKTLSLMEAVKIALASSPTILTQKLATDSAAASLQMEKGVFDPNAYTAVSTGRISAPVTSYDRQIYEGLAFLSRGEANWVAGISKNTRYGISGDFSVMVYRKDPINYDKDYITTSNHSLVNFKLNIPLLQGRGTTSAAAGEQSAQLNYEASALELRHAIAVTVYQAIAAYWDYKTAVEALKVSQASEARVKQWIDSAEAHFKQTGKLEEIEKQHQGEINSLIAYEADKKRSTIAAQEQLKQAQDNLALALGVPFDQFAKIGLPSDEFPKNLAANQLNDANLITRWSALALDGRLDLQAAKLRQQAAQVMLAKARRDVLPKLDLQLAVGYQGLSEGADFDRFPKSLTEQIYGTNTSAGLNFMYPIGNNTARGMVDQAQANYQQMVIQTNELARNIKSQINLNIAALQRRISEANMTERAVKFYQPSLEALRKQSQSNIIAQTGGKSAAPGISNLEILMGLTDIEDKLTNAIGQNLMAQAELAKAIAATRLNTGLLISLQQDENQVNIKELVTLPQ
jgi:outer membrane protein